MKILSVDDKAENLFMIEALLRGHGHEVDSAGDGETALELARRSAYDLIISDVLMPRMDGFQLCREVMEDARLRNIPFVFYTSTYTDSRDASHAFSLGAERFLVKPLEPEVFLRELEAAVADKRARRVDALSPTFAQDGQIHLRQYDSRLIARLEKKMLHLEAANSALVDEIAERERVLQDDSAQEEKRRQMQKMETLRTLAGGIAHEFNNILAGIIGFADLGLQEADDAAATTSNFREILRAGQRARETTKQILSFCRSCEGDGKPPNMGPSLAETLDLVRPTIVPASEAEAPEAAPCEPLPPQGKGERILFIDDEPMLATLGERFLKRLGYSPVVHTDALTALAHFTDQTFALVITDLTMPRASGLDVARGIWKTQPSMRIILVTGYSAAIDAARARELGFTDFLQKPYNLHGLGHAVQRALRGGAAG